MEQKPRNDNYDKFLQDHYNEKDVPIMSTWKEYCSKKKTKKNEQHYERK